MTNIITQPENSKSPQPSKFSQEEGFALQSIVELNARQWEDISALVGSLCIEGDTETVLSVWHSSNLLGETAKITRIPGVTHVAYRLGEPNILELSRLQAKYRPKFDNIHPGGVTSFRII